MAHYTSAVYNGKSSFKRTELRYLYTLHVNLKFQKKNPTYVNMKAVIKGFQAQAVDPSIMLHIQVELISGHFPLFFKILKIFFFFFYKKENIR